MPKTKTDELETQITHKKISIKTTSITVYIYITYIYINITAIVFVTVCSEAEDMYYMTNSRVGFKYKR